MSHVYLHLGNNFSPHLLDVDRMVCVLKYNLPIDLEKLKLHITQSYNAVTAVMYMYAVE